MGKIKVTKDSEVLEIEPSDLKSAINDGYRQVQTIPVTNGKEVLYIDDTDLENAIKDGYVKKKDDSNVTAKPSGNGLSNTQTPNVNLFGVNNAKQESVLTPDFKPVPTKLEGFKNADFASRRLVKGTPAYKEKVKEIQSESVLLPKLEPSLNEAEDLLHTKLGGKISDPTTSKTVEQEIISERKNPAVQYELGESYLNKMGLKEGEDVINFYHNKKSELEAEKEKVQNEYDTFYSNTVGSRGSLVGKENADILKNYENTLEVLNQKIKTFDKFSGVVNAKKAIDNTPLPNDDKDGPNYFQTIGAKVNSLSNPDALKTHEEDMATNAWGAFGDTKDIRNYDNEMTGIITKQNDLVRQVRSNEISKEDYEAQSKQLEEYANIALDRHVGAKMKVYGKALGQIIDKKRESNSSLSNAWNNIFSATPSKEEAKKAIDELKKNGATFTPKEEQFFLDNPNQIQGTAILPTYVFKTADGFAKMINPLERLLGVTENEQRNRQEVFERNFTVNPNKAFEQPETIIDVNKGDTFLKDIENPKAGELNWGYGTGQGVANAMATVTNFIVANKGFGALAKASGLGENATLIASNVASNTALTYDDAIKTAETFTKNKNEQKAYALITGVLGGLLFAKLDPEGIVKKAFTNPSKETVQSFLSAIPKEGIKAMSKEKVGEFILNTAKKAIANNVSASTILTANEIKDVVVESLFNPKTASKHDFDIQKTLAHNAITFGALSLLHGIGGARSDVAKRDAIRQSAFEASKDIPSFERDLKLAVDNKKITEAEANEKLRLVNDIAEIRNSKDIPANLSLKNQARYAVNLLNEKQIQSDIEGITDKVQIDRAKEEINQLQEERKSLIENPSEPIEIPEAPKVEGEPEKISQPIELSVEEKPSTVSGSALKDGKKTDEQLIQEIKDKQKQREIDRQNEPALPVTENTDNNRKGWNDAEYERKIDKLQKEKDEEANRIKGDKKVLSIKEQNELDESNQWHDEKIKEYKKERAERLQAKNKEKNSLRNNPKQKIEGINNDLPEFDLEYKGVDDKTGDIKTNIKDKDGNIIGFIHLNNSDGKVKVKLSEIFDSGKGTGTKLYKQLNKALIKNGLGELHSDTEFLKDTSTEQWTLDGKILTKEEKKAITDDVDKLIELDQSGRLGKTKAVQPAVKLWEKLVREGLAEKTEDGYKFKAPTQSTEASTPPKKETSGVSGSALSVKERNKIIQNHLLDNEGDIDGAFKKAGYVSVNGIWIAPEAVEYAKKVSPEVWKHLKDNGIKYLEGGDDGRGLQKTISYDGKNIRGIGVNENVGENHSGHNHTMLHELAHHVWQEELTPEQRKIFQDDNPISDYAKSVKEGKEKTLAKHDEEDFAELYAKNNGSIEKAIAEKKGVSGSALKDVEKQNALQRIKNNIRSAVSAGINKIGKAVNLGFIESHDAAEKMSIEEQHKVTQKVADKARQELGDIATFIDKLREKGKTPQEITDFLLKNMDVGGEKSAISANTWQHILDFINDHPDEKATDVLNPDTELAPTQYTEAATPKANSVSVGGDVKTLNDADRKTLEGNKFKDVDGMMINSDGTRAWSKLSDNTKALLKKYGIHYIEGYVNFDHLKGGETKHGNFVKLKNGEANGIQVNVSSVGDKFNIENTVLHELGHKVYEGLSSEQKKQLERDPITQHGKEVKKNVEEGGKTYKKEDIGEEDFAELFAEKKGDLKAVEQFLKEQPKAPTQYTEAATPKEQIQNEKENIQEPIQEGDEGVTGINEPITPKETEPTKADVGEVTPPPSEPKEVEVLVGDNGDKVSITHAAMDKLAEELGLPDRYEKDPTTISELDAAASKRIAKGEMADLIKKLENKGQPTAVEQRMMLQYVAGLKAEYEATKSDKVLQEFRKVKKLSDTVGGRDVALSLRARQGEVESKSLENGVLSAMDAKMDALNTDKLTDTQKAEVEKQVKDYKEKAEKETALRIEAEKKFSEMEAENELLRQKKLGTPKSNIIIKDGKRDFKAERQSLKDKLKQQVEEYKAAGKKMGIASDGGAESFVITTKMAKTIGEIAKNHVAEVGVKIKEVVEKTLEDVKEYFGDSITERDIMDVLAGKYNEKKQTKNELAAQMREIKTEAILLQQYESLLNKEPKSEKEKIAKNQRLKDLRDKITELEKEQKVGQYSDAAKIEASEKAAKKSIDNLEEKIAKNDLDFNKIDKPTSTQLEAYREKQKELRKEIEAKRKEAKVGQYSEIELAKRAIQRNKAAEAKIREKIAKKEYIAKPRPKNFMESPEFKQKHPKLYKDFLDSQIKKEEAQLQFDTDLVADEMKRAGLAEKWRDIWRKGTGTVKHYFASFDFSGLAVQNLPMIVTNPVIGAKGIKESAFDFASQGRHDRFLAELHNSPDWDMIKEVIRISEPKSLSEKNKEQLFPDRFRAVVKIKGKTYGEVKIGKGKYELFDISKPFERQFVSLGNALRVIKLRTEAEKLYEKGFTWEKNPEEFISLGRRINNLTSSADVPEAYKNDLTNTFVWSTKLIAAKLNMLGISDIAAFIPKSGVKKGYYKSLGIKGQKLSRQQLYAIGDLAKFATASMATTYLSALVGGGKVNTDPSDDKFLDVTFKDGVSKNYTGGFSKYIALVFQLIRQGKSSNGRFTPYSGLKDRVQQVTHFIAGKQPPITRAVVSAVAGEDYTGKKTDLGAEAAKLKYPMAAGQIAEQIKRDGMQGLFEQGIETLIGINVKDERDYPFKSEIKNYKEGGRDITKEENKDFETKRDAEVKRKIDLLKQTAAYKDLPTDEDKKKAEASMKASITESLKKEMFGEKKMSRKEERIQRRLKEAKNKISKQ